ncbi:TIGR00266 family protein [Paludisphaera rhizosphaerae]|uniref:TIGR00266 family protein n=1 Tax=Paludisphaera rhizosphaerae TaxID=2711216 RepID=UPI0013EDC962|nr:TIGR00266 family protein [Paludisphaera rhizosphaerae]
MDYEITCEPTYSVLEIDLKPGESVVAESGAMAWMTPNLRVETSTRGGLMAGLKRKVMGGESLFQNTYTADHGPGRVAFAPGSAGDVVAYELRGELLLERGAYLASSPGVRLDTRWQGLKGMFSEGLFTLHASGTGLLFFGAYGAVYEIDVDGEYIVDSGFAVAWEPSLQYRVTRARRVRSFLFSDQLLIRFSGRGRLWVQSRSPQAFANWVHPFRPVKQKNDD